MCTPRRSRCRCSWRTGRASSGASGTRRSTRRAWRGRRGTCRRGRGGSRAGPGGGLGGRAGGGGGGGGGCGVVGGGGEGGGGGRRHARAARPGVLPVCAQPRGEPGHTAGVRDAQATPAAATDRHAGLKQGAVVHA